MKVREILLLAEAIRDLEAGSAFYEQQQRGVGNYFQVGVIAILPLRRDPAWLEDQLGDRNG